MGSISALDGEMEPHPADQLPPQPIAPTGWPTDPYSTRMRPAALAAPPRP